MNDIVEDKESYWQYTREIYMRESQMNFTNEFL